MSHNTDLSKLARLLDTGTNGQVLTSQGGNAFSFADATGGGGASVTSSDTAPSSPSAGDLWFDSSTAELLVYYSDGSSNQWVTVSGEQGPQGATGVAGSAGAAGSNAPTIFTGLTDTPSSFSGQGGKTVQVNSGGSALEFVAPVASGGGSLEATASGALANGDTVIINANGTVSKVAGSIGLVIGAESTFETGGYNGEFSHSCYDESADKVVFVYTDTNNNNYGTCLIGTVSSSNTITFGTPTVFSSESSYVYSVIYDAGQQKVVVGYKDSSNYGTQKVGSVSGSSISFGSAYKPFGSVTVAMMDQCYDSGSGKVVFVGTDGSNSNKLTSIVCTISGSAIGYGSKQEVLGDAIGELRIASTGAGRFLTVYKRPTQLYGTISTLSGTSLTHGISHSIEASTILNYPDVVWLPSVSRFAVAFNRSSRGYIRLRTIYGTGTSAQTNHAAEVEVPQSDNAKFPKLIYNLYEGHPYISYNVSSESKIRKATCTSNSVSFGTRESVDNSNNTWPNPVYDPDTKTIVVSFWKGSDNSGRARVVNPASVTTNVTTENYIGISDAAYSDGATSTIQISGAVDDAQSGLTAGQSYYVQIDGTLGTTAASPSVFAGTAVSATKLIVKG